MLRRICIKLKVAIIVITTIISTQLTEVNAVTIHRFDKFISGISRGDTASLSARANEFSDVYNGFVKLLLNDTTQSTEGKLATFADLNNIKFFYNDVDSVFKNTDRLKVLLDSIESRLSNSLNIHLDKIFTIISPYNQPIIALNDTAIAVALNHFLGAGYPPYSYYPNYVRRFKTPEKLPYSIVEYTLRKAYPYEPTDTSLIERVAYEGFISYAVKSVMPQFSDCTFFNFTEQQMAWAIENEQSVFYTILKYAKSTDWDLQRNIMAVAPFSSVISPQSPGGVGRWIGLRMVESYMNNGIEIASMLKNKEYQKYNNLIKKYKHNGK